MYEANHTFTENADLTHKHAHKIYTPCPEEKGAT